VNVVDRWNLYLYCMIIGGKLLGREVRSPQSVWIFPCIDTVLRAIFIFTLHYRPSVDMSVTCDTNTIAIRPCVFLCKPPRPRSIRSRGTHELQNPKAPFLADIATRLQICQV